MSGYKHHELHVNLKTFSVELHFFDRVVSKTRTRSLLDFSAETSWSNGVLVLFLEARLVIHEDAVVNGIYHAIKDQFEHGITASDNPAINILMHMFGTNQIETIKQTIVPPSFNDSRAEYRDVVMILVSESRNASSIAGLLSKFHDNFECEVPRVPVFPAEVQLSAAKAWLPTRELACNATGQSSINVKLVEKLASARMALFSLSLQQKR